MLREAGKIDKAVRAAIRKASTDGIAWPLVVCGNPGTGKTCAGLCVADHVPGAEWWAWEEFWRWVQEINMGRFKGSPSIELSPGYREITRHVNWTTRSLWKWFKGLSLAVIDDVGLRGDANDTQYESLKQALDQRAGLPLIVTSNLDVVGLGKVFDLRIMDRLSAGTVVELFGKEAKSMR